jgi:hypothetical protein
VEDVDSDDDDEGFSDFAELPGELDARYEASLLLYDDLECKLKFVLPFKTNSLQSAFVTLEVLSVDTFDDCDRGIEAVLLFNLFSALAILCVPVLAGLLGSNSRMKVKRPLLVFSPVVFVLPPLPLLWICASCRLLLDRWNGCAASGTS